MDTESSNAKPNKNVPLFLSIALLVIAGFMGSSEVVSPLLHLLSPFVIFAALVAFTLWATKPKSKLRWGIVGAIVLYALLVIASLFVKLNIGSSL